MADLLDRLTDAQRDRVERSDPPHWTAPMLATLTHDPFSDDNWIYERKLDGERCLVFRSPGRVRLMSRNKKNLNAAYPELKEAVGAIGVDRFIADGEIVAFDGRVTSFARLQQRLGLGDPEEARASNVKVYLYLFDLLHADGYDLTALPQRARKKLLRAMPGMDDPIRFTPHRNRDGLDYLRRACDKGWEGLVAKRADAPYQHRRSKDWLKFKCSNRQEFVIVGFTDPRGERIGFGALILGYYDHGELVDAGRVGTGFDHAFLEQWRDRLDRIERRTTPLDRPPPSVGGDDVHWVTPRYVGEVAFTEWTEDGRLRHPRFIGMRHDKAPEDVHRERPRDPSR